MTEVCRCDCHNREFQNKEECRQHEEAWKHVGDNLKGQLFVHKGYPGLIIKEVIRVDDVDDNNVYYTKIGFENYIDRKSVWMHKVTDTQKASFTSKMEREYIPYTALNIHQRSEYYRLLEETYNSVSGFLDSNAEPVEVNDESR